MLACGLQWQVLCQGGGLCWHGNSVVYLVCCIGYKGCWLPGGFMTKEIISVRVKVYGNDYRETLVHKNGSIPEFPHHIDSCEVHENDINKLKNFLIEFDNDV